MGEKLHNLEINPKPGVFENKIHDWELKPYLEDKSWDQIKAKLKTQGLENHLNSAIIFKVPRSKNMGPGAMTNFSK